MKISALALIILVCKVLVIRSEEVTSAAPTTAQSRDNLTSVDLIAKNEENVTSSSTTISVESTTVKIAETTKEPDSSHLLIPPATDKAQIVNANVTTKKPSRFQAAL